MLRSANYRELVEPRTRGKRYGTRSFRAAAPFVWNSLPRHPETMTLVANNSVAIWRHFYLHGPTRQRCLWERLFKGRFINGLTSYLLTYIAMVIFQLNLDYLPSHVPEQNHWRYQAQVFWGRTSPNPQCQSAERNSDLYWPRNITHWPRLFFLVHGLTAEGMEDGNASFMPSRQQYWMEQINDGKQCDTGSSMLLGIKWDCLLL